MRLKKERWLVEEQMRHVQEERKTSMKEEQKCLPEEKIKERIDFDEDEIEEEKLKLPKRKRKNLSRRTVAELQQKVNLKASSNMVARPSRGERLGAERGEKKVNNMVEREDMGE
ncbi:hypothetical protein TNCV_2618891 [Trichonephila clavipes]|nr:hypothetical protein TNCV_2618891 [Trichonephila clavipes]